MGSPASFPSWANPGNITADDATYATRAGVGGFSNFDTDWLVADQFDFSSVPDNALITGLTVRVQAHHGSGDAVTFGQINIGKSDSTLGTAKTNATALTTSPTNYNFGGTSDLWGLSISVSEVKASTFQARVWFDAHKLDDVFVDAIWMRVTYTPRASKVRSCIIG